MTNTEKVFAFGLPIAALVLSLFAILRPRRPGTTPTNSSPPVVVDVSGGSNCTASPQHPFMLLGGQNEVYFNAADFDATSGAPIYWVEFNTSTCRNNPTDTGDNYRVPTSTSGSPYGYSRPYTAASVSEADITYIVCNDSPTAPPPKCSKGPSMDGLHVKPGP